MEQIMTTAILKTPSRRKLIQQSIASFEYEIGCAKEFLAERRGQEEYVVKEKLEDAHCMRYVGHGAHHFAGYPHDERCFIVDAKTTPIKLRQRINDDRIQFTQARRLAVEEFITSHERSLQDLYTLLKSLES